MSVIEKIKQNLALEPPQTERFSLGRIDFAVLAALVVAGLALRLLYLPYYDVISNDGTAYVRVARGIQQGNFGGIASYGFYPVLVWLTGHVVPDLERAGRLVSVLTGSLLCIPVYLLGAELFSRRVAAAACTVMVIWPSLRHWSCEVMTQSTYILLVCTGIYLIWRMVRGSSAVVGAAAGIALGLAYVTRTEAILVCLVTPLPLLYVYRSDIRSKFPAMAAYAVSFAAIAGANLLLIHSLTGQWQLASKTSVALIDALSYIKQIPDMNYIPGVEPTSYLDILKNYPLFVVKNTLKNLAALPGNFIPAPLWALLLIGTAAGGFRAERNLVRLFLLSTCAPVAVIIVFYYVNPEYLLPYLPVALLFCAEGFRAAEEFTVARLPASFLPSAVRQWLPCNPLTLTAAAMFAMVMVWNQIPDSSANAAYLPESDDGRRDQKNLGLVIKNNLPPGKIMTRWSRIAFYADREWAMIPHTDYYGILTAARENGVRFLIVDGGLYNIRPGLGEELFDPFIPGNYPDGTFFNSVQDVVIKPGLRPYLLYLNRPTSMGVAVYEIIR